MSAEKPHKPTPKRLAEFRKRGEIARAPELIAAGALVGGAVGLSLTAQGTIGRIAELTARGARELDAAAGAGILHGAISTFAFAIAPVAIGAMMGATTAGFLQLGWPPAIRFPTLDVARVFSPGSIVEALSPKAAAGRLGRALLRTAFLGLAIGVVLKADLAAFLRNPMVDPLALAKGLGATVSRIALLGCGALLAASLFDWVMARRKLTNQMMMSTQEVKQEHREQEGDPMVKGLRRRRARDLARRRLTAVKTATVVLVNPTEYAVALRYDADKDRAPTVIAKGRGKVAERIRELARKAGVPIIAQPPLCRLLHKLVPEGKEIPASAYKAVAEILAYVYKLRRRRA